MWRPVCISCLLWVALVQGRRSPDNLARELNTAKRTIEKLEKENELLRSCASDPCIKRLGLDRPQQTASKTANPPRNAPVKYENLGAGICTAGGSFFVETCVYSNIATPGACEEACTRDADCQAYVVSKEHTECNHWTTSKCAKGGEKYNEGSTGLVIDGVAKNTQYLNCMKKEGFHTQRQDL